MVAHVSTHIDAGVSSLRWAVLHRAPAAKRVCRPMSMNSLIRGSGGMQPYAHSHLHCLHATSFDLLAHFDCEFRVSCSSIYCISSYSAMEITDACFLLVECWASALHRGRQEEKRNNFEILYAQGAIQIVYYQNLNGSSLNCSVRLEIIIDFFDITAYI